VNDWFSYRLKISAHIKLMLQDWLSMMPLFLKQPSVKKQARAHCLEITPDTNALKTHATGAKTVLD
jgi:hypothetical protein